MLNLGVQEVSAPSAQPETGSYPAIQGSSEEHEVSTRPDLALCSIAYHDRSLCCGFPYCSVQGWQSDMIYDFVVPRCQVPTGTLVTLVGVSGELPYYFMYTSHLYGGHTIAMLLHA